MFRHTFFKILELGLVIVVCPGTNHAASQHGGRVGGDDTYIVQGCEFGICGSFTSSNNSSSVTHSAPCSSASPPISPIIIIPLVSGSFKKTSRQSMKLVPLKGSPPIPTQRVWPKPVSEV